MAGKRKKKGNSIFMTVLVTVLSLTLVTLTVVVCAYFAGHPIDSERESYVGSAVIEELATENISVKINMESCMMTVGTKTQVTATIYPNGSSAGIMWTSSDENVFTVDTDGNLEVVGAGIVALTANFGEVCDSIAIECVKEKDDSVLNLPDYGMFTVKDETLPAAPDVPTESTSARETEAVTEGPKPTKEEPTSKPVQPTQPTTTAVQPTQPTTPKQTEEEVTSYTLETTTEYTGKKVLSTQLAEKLEEYGFTKYLDNTYVFEENNTYSGEVIITANMTHIYIKQHSEAFDNAILTILTVLLPDSHEEIWQMYNSASVDQTVTVDGRVVRVVVPEDTGHSQIVIYN